MGQAFTRVYSYAARELKMFNIEKRAAKVISKKKPTPAPMFPSTIKELERLSKENVSKEYLLKKDKQLDEYLKKVYVTTPYPDPSVLNLKEKVEGGPDQPLPQNRFTDTEPSFGYSEMEERTVPLGRLSLKQAIQLIADHRSQPQKHTNTAIAAQYKLPITLTDDILEHFKMFDLHVQKEIDPDKQSAYQKLQLRVKEMNFVNVTDIMKEFPQFRKRTFFKNKKEVEEIKDSEEVTTDIDKNNINIQKDKKKKL